MKKKLYILGTRGIPARHGGFETFAEKLSIYLRELNWDVTVYCQEFGAEPPWESEWNGVKRIHIPVSHKGTPGTVYFDWKATRNALSKEGLFLTLGYNTAVFNFMQKLKGQVNIINMDGIEWRRDKWGLVARFWFLLNERAGCLVANHLIADHPQIKQHLATRVSPEKITMIPYGGDDILTADEALLGQYNLKAGEFSTIIARPEPENSVLEMVSAFSRCARNHKLVVLGNFDPGNNPYHSQVMASSSVEVVFLGAIYEKPIIQSLRNFSRFYLHGHRVGGTNPSLVEGLGAGCAIVAHDNPFNRWVAGPGSVYFSDEQSCSDLLDRLLRNTSTIIQMKNSSKRRFEERFTWDQVLQEYEVLLSEWHRKIVS